MLDVNSLILVTSIMLLLGIVSSKFSARIGMPVLVLFVLIGMLAGSEGLGGIDFEDYDLANSIGTIALCVILFDGGLRTPYHSVRAVWKPAAALATGGVLITAGITGVAASWILKIPLIEGLLLGSIVGSTDASAVFSVLRSGGVALRRRLADTLEIESGSNDPMAVFLTVGLVQVITQTVSPGWGLLSLFLTQLVVGTVVGLLAGRVAVAGLNRINVGAAGLYPVFAMAFALFSFGLAAVFGGSGFLAVYLTGMTIGNRRPVFHRGILHFHDAASWICQILMFTALGLLSFPSRLLSASGPAIVIAVTLTLVARPVAVLVCASAFGFSKKELAFLSWVGLKGAVPITLATFPMLAGIPGAWLIFDSVFFIVLISTLIQGWTLPVVARVLNLAETPRLSPPVTLEISSLTHVDGDIVDYSITDECLAAGRMIRDLALPHGAVIAMIVRGHELISPHGETLIQAGDHVILVVRPAIRELVDRVFCERAAQIQPIAMGVEFPMRGSARVRAINEIYQLQLEGPDHLTLDQLIRSKSAARQLDLDSSFTFGNVRLRTLELSADGSVHVVSLSVQPNAAANSSSSPDSHTAEPGTPEQSSQNGEDASDRSHDHQAENVADDSTSRHRNDVTHPDPE